MSQRALLETFPNPYPRRGYEIRMSCDEFTSLCPIGGIEGDAGDLSLLGGGAPDFGTIMIAYTPNRLCVELKSLKLYLWSYRNDGVFYERAVNQILDDLADVTKPKRMTVVGNFNIRGGIKSVITASTTRRRSS